MKIFGVELSRLKYRDFFDKIKDPEEKTIIFTPNPEILLSAKFDEDFKKLLNKADYNIPDGIGIYAGFQILDNNFGKLINLFLIPFYGFKLFTSRKELYSKYGQRICGSDLTADLLNFANEKGYSIAILEPFFEAKTKGDFAKMDSINNTIPKLKIKYPNCSFYQFIYKKENISEIIKDINNTDCRYLFSTLGAIKQEKAIDELMPKLDKIKVATGIGGSIDFLIGFKKRAPRIFVKLGLEWLWRMIINPSRMIKRVWRAIFVFLWEVIKEK